jgi:hypothetical protein
LASSPCGSRVAARRTTACCLHPPYRSAAALAPNLVGLKNR